MLRWLLSTLTLLASWTALSIRADDWPQWRGADRTGVSPEKGLLKAWPKDGPPLVWSFKNAGLGFSSYAIRDGKFFTLGTRDKQEIVLVLDAAKGTELWTAKIGEIFTFDGNTWGDGPRSTPTLDGNLLYALGGQGDLVCLDLTKNGGEVWRKNLIKDFDGEMMSDWGYSESPLVDGDNVIVTPGSAKNGTIVALNKKTGATVWQCKELTHKAPYSSAVVAEIHGVRQYVQLSFAGDDKGGFVNGIEAKTGKLLWSQQIFSGASYAACPTPIVKDNVVYVTTGYGGGCHLFEIGKVMDAKELYSKKVQKSTKNTHGGVVLVDGHIYGHSEGLGWVCQELKGGKIQWSEKNEFETRSGAITAADGMLYFYTEEGEVGLVKAATDGFDKVSSFKIPATSEFPAKLRTSRSSKAWSYPVIANGMLYVRDCEFIYCYDIREKK